MWLHVCWDMPGLGESRRQVSPNSLPCWREAFSVTEDCKIFANDFIFANFYKWLTWQIQYYRKYSPRFSVHSRNSIQTSPEKKHRVISDQSCGWYTDWQMNRWLDRQSNRWTVWLLYASLFGEHKCYQIENKTPLCLLFIF